MRSIIVILFLIFASSLVSCGGSDKDDVTSIENSTPSPSVTTAVPTEWDAKCP